MLDIVFDVETTGLDPQSGHRITELGCVEVRDFIPTGRTFQTYLNPERIVEAKAVEITGLTNEFLADKPVFADMVDAFLEFVGEGRLVAHNAAFDRGFINAELERAGRKPITDMSRWVDTLEIARTMFPGMHNSLDALCKRFSVNLDARDKHGALLDARLLAEVYLEMNGGREQSLDFAPDAAGVSGQNTGAGRLSVRPQRAGLATPEERARHAEFIADLGAKPIWAAVDAGPTDSQAG